MQVITKTFIVYAEGEPRPLEDLKQSLQQRNDCIVTESNFKNSFLLKMTCNIGHCTIRCCKGSFGITGVKDEMCLINCMKKIISTPFVVVPVMENLKAVLSDKPLDLEHVLTLINESENPEEFAYFTKRHRLTIKIVSDISNIPVRYEATEGPPIYSKLSETPYFKQKPRLVSIFLFNSGKAVFSGAHRSCIEPSINRLRNYLNK